MKRIQAVFLILFAAAWIVIGGYGVAIMIQAFGEPVPGEAA